MYDKLDQGKVLGHDEPLTLRKIKSHLDWGEQPRGVTKDGWVANRVADKFGGEGAKQGQLPA